MPTMPEVMHEQSVSLVPRDVFGYLRSRGWKQFRTVGNLMVFNRDEPGSLDQALVPVDSAKPDFAARMADVVEKLSSFEGRSPSAILTDLSNYDADVLRFRVATRGNGRGTLPLIQAIDLLAGARQSLLAAAHSALVPRRHHPKLSRTEAVQLLDACNLNQTEQTSFVVAISCPMRAVDADQAGLLPGQPPFARQATSLLGMALSNLNDAIQQDSLAELVDDTYPIVSANLCGALLKMRPLQSDGILQFIPTWASSVSNEVDKPLPRPVTFSEDEFDAIEDVYRELRPAQGLEAKPWVAYVDELRGTDGPDGTREGEVVFTLFADDELIRVRATLTREQYQVAYRAHNPTRPLAVIGQLHRGPRVSRLLQVTLVEPLSVDRNVVTPPPPSPR